MPSRWEALLCSIGSACSKGGRNKHGEWAVSVYPEGGLGEMCRKDFSCIYGDRVIVGDTVIAVD